VQTTPSLLCQSGHFAAQTVLFPEYEDAEQQQQTNGLSLADKGAMGELLFDLWCMGQGIAVYQPKSNQTKEDRVIRIGSKYLAVQIKGGRVGNARNGSTAFTIWCGNPHTGKKRKPMDGDADLLVMVGMDYSNPSLHNSFGVFVPWSSDLPQSINIRGPVAVWPCKNDVERML
jgi:hypothetical protein